jgi:hypothetical protein
MTKAEIEALSDDELERLSVVRKKELDDVQSEIGRIEAEARPAVRDQQSD